MRVAAIDIGGTAIKSGIFEDGGAPTLVREVPTLSKQGVDALIDQICELVRSYGPVDRVGVSCTGQVDARRGMIVFASEAIPGFSGTPLRERLEQGLGLPVTIDNDVNCAAMGEAHFGAGRDLEDFICLTIGTGIGGAIVIGKRVYYGARGLAGEMGHIPIHAGSEGEACLCGKQGCYEAYGSVTALSNRVEKALGQRLNGREIFARFEEAPMRREIDGWIDEIVYGLVSLTHIFNPPCFVLGGGILNEPYLRQEIGPRLKKSVLVSYQDVEVRRALLGNEAGMYGAYYHAVNDMEQR